MEILVLCLIFLSIWMYYSPDPKTGQVWSSIAMKDVTVVSYKNGIVRCIDNYTGEELSYGYIWFKLTHLYKFG